MATYRGDNRANTYRGTSRDDEIFGLGGDDVLFGMDGDDEIEGGDGDDRLNGGEGDDRLWGGRGRDTLVVDYTGLGSTGLPVVSDIEWARSGYEGRVFTNSDETRFEEFEVLDLTFGRGNDAVNFDGAGLAAGAKATLDGGQGGDTLVADFSAMRNVNLTARSATLVELGNVGTFRNFEGFNLTLGFGTNTVNLSRLGTTFFGPTLTLGAGTNVITLGNTRATVIGAGGLDQVEGGTGYTEYRTTFTDSIARTATWDGRDLTLDTGGYVRRVFSVDVTFGSGADLLTITGALNQSYFYARMGGGNDRVVFGNPDTILSNYFVELGDGDDRIEASGLYPSGEFFGGNGADTATFTVGPYEGSRGGMDRYVIFRGGNDAAIDTLIADYSGLEAYPDPDFTINSSGGITSSITGLSGGIGAPDLGGVLFYETEALDLTLSTRNDRFSVTVSAIKAGVSATVRAGDGMDGLTFDFRQSPDAVLTTSADGTITSAIGTFEGFETVSIQLGGGTNRLQLRGNVTTTVLGGAGVDVVSVEDGGGTLRGFGGDDVLSGGVLYGGDGDDRLTIVIQGNAAGEGGSDLIEGGSGDNQLVGGFGGFDGPRGSAADGDDVISGGAGRDNLYGDDGNDRLEGGAGSDQFYGDRIDYVFPDSDREYAGADTFVFLSAADIVSVTGVDVDGNPFINYETVGDFNRGDGDIIDLSGIDTDPTRRGDQGFTFIGAADLSIPRRGDVFQLHYVQFGNGAYLIEGDLNRDGVADFQLAVVSDTAPVASDFRL